MGDTKEFSINWPNRIKYEKEGDFKNSLFSVYIKRQRNTLEISLKIMDGKRDHQSRKHTAMMRISIISFRFWVREEWVRPQRWYPLLYHCRRVISI